MLIEHICGNGHRFKTDWDDDKEYMDPRYHICPHESCRSYSEWQYVISDETGMINPMILESCWEPLRIVEEITIPLSNGSVEVRPARYRQPWNDERMAMMQGFIPFDYRGKVPAKMKEKEEG